MYIYIYIYTHTYIYIYIYIYALPRHVAQPACGDVPAGRVDAARLASSDDFASGRSQIHSEMTGEPVSV